MNNNLLILIIFILSLSSTFTQNTLLEKSGSNCQGPKAFKALTDYLFSKPYLFKPLSLFIHQNITRLKKPKNTTIENLSLKKLMK